MGSIIMPRGLHLMISEKHFETSTAFYSRTGHRLVFYGGRIIK